MLVEYVVILKFKTQNKLTFSQYLFKCIALNLLLYTNYKTNTKRFLNSNHNDICIIKYQVNRYLLLAKMVKYFRQNIHYNNIHFKYIQNLL